MTKEYFTEEQERLKNALIQLKEDYLNSYPYSIESNVKMMLAGSGRIVEGIVLSLGINVDKEIYITSYKCNKDKKTKYCTVAQQKVKLLDG